jgi:apolipoprotein N-acyltransferase
VESGFSPPIKLFFFNLIAILGGAVLFALSFPNPLFSSGLPFLAWIAYVPVFWVIKRSTTVSLVFWGALYGYISYSLFTPWLGVFHPLAGTIVSLLQLCYMALLFPLLRLAVILYSKKGYFLQWLLWLAYEYLRTLGFLGFPYGITGYTQWKFPSLIGIASVFGVWGISALVLFPSVYLGSGLHESSTTGRWWVFFRRERLAAAAWLGALAASLVFGCMRLDYARESAGEVKIALIQQNADPWKEENHSFALRTLTTLSQNALDTEPDTELVVWPETAFIPRIFWHLTYRDNANSYLVVRELLDFLKSQKVPFLIGNDDARLEVNSEGRWDRTDYNAALYFEGETLKQIYRKIHLVPFAEYFPYQKTFPRLYKTLAEADTHFWKPGKELVVFEAERTMAAYLEDGRFRFSALVCFEDCFGSISRDFTRRGAELLVNLSNDAWSESLSCQVQHLSMAVFRAAENRRSLVRAASSGQTCAIAPSGKILAMAEPFTGTALTTKVPLMKGRTPYTVWGDLWGLLFLAAALILLLTGTIRYILNRKQNKGH